jgi:bla regulator protein blaR1
MTESLMSLWIFDSLLVTTLLMAAILLVRRPVARMFGAGVAYALWLIPAARLLMPSLTSEVAPVGESSQAVSDAVRESILTSVGSGEPVTAIAAAPNINFAALVVTIWLGGAVLFFIVQMIRYAAMRDDLLSDATEIAKIDGVRVVASDQVAGPLAFGLFKRFIAVPQNFTKAYSPAERELAIAHEMAHHKSGDLFANLAAFAVLCLMWFNPLAWMSWSAFRFDQEAACDARVLSGKCAEDRVIYGQALARAAFDGVPTFATALNTPKTIIERLRRLATKDASNKRRMFGKLGILTAAAIVLPFTATIAPAINAQDDAVAPADDAAPKIVKKVKIIKIDRNGKTVDIIGHDGDGKEVTKVERNGKIFIFRTDKKLSQDEVEKMTDDAQRSHEDANGAMVWADEARGDAEAARGEAEAARGEAEAMRGHAEVMQVHAMAMAANYIPEIDISEITKNCRDGQPVTTNVEGFDGTTKSRVKIVMCGKGQAKLVRVEALKGLREARSEIASEEDMPENIRKDVLKKLEQQIRRLEARLN